MSRSDAMDTLRGSTSLERMISFVSEAALLCYPLLCQDLSLVAAAAVYLARRYCAPAAPVDTIWTHTLAHYSGYTRDDFAGVLIQLNEGISRMPTARCKGLFRKFERLEAGGVSAIAGRLAGGFVEDASGL